LKKSFFYLFAILIIATILRVYQLDKVPPSLFGDEIDVGYQAYSLLKTGKDLHGNNWPSLVHSLSEYRAPLFIYSAIPFVGIFGLNEWGVRFPAVFFGILGVFGVFLLTKRLFNEKIGLLASFFLAISPWHIHYSRAAFEVTMLLTFFIFGTYFFLRGLENRYFLILSAIFLGLTPYIYSTAVLFLPLLILVLFFSYRSLKPKRTIFTISICVLILILIPYGLQTISGRAGERFNIVSIFASRDLRDKVILLQQTEKLPGNFQRFFHNKGVEWGKQISMNYLRAFSPEFLLIQGDPNSRHSVHEMGQMYLFEIFLLITGLLIALNGFWKRENKLVLGWLLIAPIPAALTFDGGFHATRNFLMLVPLVIFLGMGIDRIFNNRELLSKKKEIWRCLSITLVILIMFNFIFFLHRYFIHYPSEQWRAWHFGFKEAMQYLKENEKNYSSVFINNTYEPSLIRFLFWVEYDPAKFHKEFTTDQPNIKVTGFEGFGVNKFYFGEFNGPFEQFVSSRSLYVTSARDDITNPEILKDPGIRLLKTVYSPANEPIFYIITGNNE